jgi:hypothetical protein
MPLIVIPSNRLSEIAAPCKFAFAADCNPDPALCLALPGSAGVRLLRCLWIRVVYWPRSSLNTDEPTGACGRRVSRITHFEGQGIALFDGLPAGNSRGL